jgi:cytochrome oxidase Cu insertion factor (SCO1/SenC/PrrC family)/cytochrome c2
LRSWTPVLLLLFVSAPTFGTPGSAGRKGGDRWGANYFPNVRLVTHEGKSVRFFDDLIKDKVVVINFIYTSCPDTCPLETARLTEVQAILGDRVGRDIFMYSISIDPARDTPQVLKEYADRYHAGPGWTFLTGSEDDITLLRKKLGLYVDPVEDNPFNHNLSLIIGNQTTGRWMKRSPFENPYVLAIHIGEWLHNWKQSPQDAMDYSNAPKLRNITQGEYLFRTRCNVCHSIGSDDNIVRVGPDLLGVTERRERAWVARWISEPDKMLAEKDPISQGLFLAYNKVPMPNMRLTKVDVNALIEYLRAESRRVERARNNGEVVSAARGPGATDSCCQKGESATISPTPTTSEAAGSGGRKGRRGFSEASFFSMATGIALGGLVFLRRRRSSVIQSESGTTAES